MNALGRTAIIQPVSPSRASEGTTIVHQWWAVHSRTESYEFSTQPRPALNQRNRKNRVSRAFWRRNSRDIAGLNESELKAENMNENTIVIANWLYSLPVIPGMNATGTNTAARTRVIVTIGVVISAIAARVASSGARPSVEELSPRSRPR